MTNKKICKFFMNGNCKKGVDCDFTHDDNLCKHYFNGNCKFGDKCKLSHLIKSDDNNKYPNANNGNIKYDKTDSFIFEVIIEYRETRATGNHDTLNCIRSNNDDNKAVARYFLSNENNIRGKIKKWANNVGLPV